MKTVIQKITVAGLLFLIFPFSVFAINDVQFAADTDIQILTADTSVLSTVTAQTGGAVSNVVIETNYMDVTLDNGSSVTFSTVDNVYFRATVQSGSGSVVTPSCPLKTISLSSVANTVVRIELIAAIPQCNPAVGGSSGGGGNSIYFPPLQQSSSGSQQSTQQNTQESESLPFTDIEGHWAKDYILKLNKKCNVQGYRDAAGKPLLLFKPDNSITRAELVKILIQCQYGELKTPENNPFADVDKNAWYGAYVAKGQELGWIEGYKDKLFRPDKSINRAEAVKVILLSGYQLFQITGGEMNFKDTVKGAWYEKFIAFSSKFHFVDGYLNFRGEKTGFFGPQNNLTRAEAAKIISLVKGW